MMKSPSPGRISARATQPPNGLRTRVTDRTMAVMPKPRPRLKRADIIRALTRLDELCAAQRDNGKRWLVKELLDEVSREEKAAQYAWARAELLRSSPAAFRERNLFTTEDALHRV
ncbi:MAG: hypothetical protein Q7S40_29115 [Opitutaceae bacterium]|nr:hypothetical protein [Opitutaceae bacterium]